MKKELLDQCNRWHEEDEFQRIADAVSEVPEEEWDYELVSQLARAYNNLGEYQKALELLESVKAEGETDPLWHFRIGYSLYYLDRDQEAKEEFERPEGLEILKALGIEGEYEGIGHCALGYVKGDYPSPPARKKNWVYYVD